MFKVTRYNGQTDRTTTEVKTNTVEAARVIADAENARRPAGSSDHYGVQKA